MVLMGKKKLSFPIVLSRAESPYNIFIKESNRYAYSFLIPTNTFKRHLLGKLLRPELEYYY